MYPRSRKVTKSNQIGSYLRRNFPAVISWPNQRCCSQVFAVNLFIVGIAVAGSLVHYFGEIILSNHFHEKRAKERQRKTSLKIFDKNKDKENFGTLRLIGVHHKTSRKIIFIEGRRDYNTVFLDKEEVVRITIF